MATANLESLTKQESSNRLEIESQSDDRRRVKNWPMVRILLHIRGSVVGIFLVAWLFAEIEKLGLNFGLTVGCVPFLTLFGGLSLALVAALMIPFLIKRYREQDFEPVESASFVLIRYRQKSDMALDEAGFRKVGTFRVKGVALPTRSEVYLGCQQRVIAAFLSTVGTRATEMVSITESGRVIVTRSEAAKEDEPSEESLPYIVVTTVANSSFEKMLAIHLSKSTETSEQADSSIAELTDGDVVDVLRYYSRAHHDMLVKRGLAHDQVGPMTYGRFRFPLGIVSYAAGRRTATTFKG